MIVWLHPTGMQYPDMVVLWPDLTFSQEKGSRCIECFHGYAIVSSVNFGQSNE